MRTTRGVRRARLAWLAGVATGTAAVTAAADDPTWSPGERTTSRVHGEIRPDDALIVSDGVYGRFDGRYDIGLDVGTEFAEGGPAFAARTSLHYFFMAGIYAGYTDDLGGNAASERAVSFGVDIRPAFIPRWSRGLQQGPSVLDLFIDSISLGLGAYFREPPRGDFGDRRGLELSAGFGVPLTGEMAGPWLGARGIFRWDDPRERSSADAWSALLVTAGWHFVAGP
jgi:hypothetical protein